MDFRVLLDRLGDNVDAVSVSIPDHMHALVGIEAMKRRKHLYCQKALAHTVWECRQMQQWAAKTGVITQHGTQGHSSTEYRLATRLVREGVIGKVKEIHSWCPLTGNERPRPLFPLAKRVLRLIRFPIIDSRCAFEYRGGSRRFQSHRRRPRAVPTSASRRRPSAVQVCSKS